MYLVRSTLSEAIHEKSKGMKSGFMQDKDFKDSHVQEIQSFLDGSISFVNIYNFRGMHLLFLCYRFLNGRYADSVAKAMDISFLWFREFHLLVDKSVEVSFHCIWG